MKKEILLIGNSDGLVGVKVDLDNYAQFFKSEIGGGWYDSEITTLMNPTKEYLLAHLYLMKVRKPDHAIVVFSGHGGFKRETVLSINEKDEQINESVLKDIGKKQITIYDCCRVQMVESIQKSVEFRNFAEKTASVSRTREKYEARVNQAIEQQIVLYACAIGESADDTGSNGGRYTTNLLKSARNVNEKYLLVSHAHQSAKLLTTSQNPKQNPDACLPRCLPNQQLIININPKMV